MALDLTNAPAGKSRSKKKQEAEVIEQQLATPAASGQYAAQPVRITAAGRIPVIQAVQYVTCPLFPAEVSEDGTELFPALEVGFAVNNPQRYLSGDAFEFKNNVEKYCMMMAALAPQFRGWAFAHPFTEQPIPMPTPADWRTYSVMLDERLGLTPLGLWIIGPGIVSAIADYYDVPDPNKLIEAVEGIVGGIVPVGGEGYDQALEKTLGNSESV